MPSAVWLHGSQAVMDLSMNACCVGVGVAKPRTLGRSRQPDLPVPYFRWRNVSGHRSKPFRIRAKSRIRGSSGLVEDAERFRHKCLDGLGVRYQLCPSSHGRSLPIFRMEADARGGPLYACIPLYSTAKSRPAMQARPSVGIVENEKSIVAKTLHSSSSNELSSWPNRSWRCNDILTMALRTLPLVSTSSVEAGPVPTQFMGWA